MVSLDPFSMNWQTRFIRFLSLSLFLFLPLSLSMNTRNLATLFTRRISLLHEAALWPWNANETLFFFHVDRWPMCRGGVGVFFFLSFFYFFYFFLFHRAAIKAAARRRRTTTTMMRIGLRDTARHL